MLNVKSINGDILLEESEDIFKKTVIINNSSRRISVENEVKEILFPDLSIYLNNISYSKNKNLEFNINQINNFLKKMIRDSDNIEAYKTNSIGFNNVSYYLNTNFFLEWLVKPIIKEFNERNLCISLENEEKIYIESSIDTKSFKSNQKLKIKINLNKDLLSIINKKKDIDIINEEFEKIKNILENICSIKFSNFLLSINPVLNGEIPIAKKEFGLNNEFSGVELFKIKYNFFIDKLDINIENNINCENFKKELDFIVKKDLLIYNSNIKDTTKLSDLEEIRIKGHPSGLLCSSYFRGQGILNYIRNMKDIFYINEDNSVFEIKYDNSFFIHGFISLETFEKIKNIVNKTNSSILSTKFIRLISLKK